MRHIWLWICLHWGWGFLLQQSLRVGNLSQTLLKLKDRGFWIYGADASGRKSWDMSWTFPLVLVIGSEGKGLRPLVSKSCDELVSIPQSKTGVASLNASCAASVVLYEISRQTNV